jgi:hypothetical protein
MLAARHGRGFARFVRPAYFLQHEHGSTTLGRSREVGEREVERTIERGSGGQVAFKLKVAHDQLQQITAQLDRQRGGGLPQLMHLPVIQR